MAKGDGQRGWPEGMAADGCSRPVQAERATIVTTLWNCGTDPACMPCEGHAVGSGLARTHWRRAQTVYDAWLGSIPSTSEQVDQLKGLVQR